MSNAGANGCQSADENQRERQWIKEIQAGDEEAFEAMFVAYHARLCAFARQYVTSTAAAKDLVQEVFARIWQRRQQWDPGGTVRAYLYKAVRNRTIDHHRREQVRDNCADEVARIFPGEPPLTPFKHLTRKELEAYLRRTVGELPERRRRIFVLSRVHRLTYEEIAEALGISVHTVHTQIKRALRYLRERLARYRREAGPAADEPGGEPQAARYIEGMPPAHLN